MSKKNNLRTPKGTYDLIPEVATVKAKIESICESVYIKHCGVKLETPTFELRENLYDKYGEDTKLIFNLEDQGGDICSLRYDLTVPLSRYLSKTQTSRLRRYQIASVFRRDKPSKGRLREFTQADFDITGTNLPMVYDSECLKICDEILDKLEKEFDVLEDYIIKISDRRILCGLMDHLEIEEENQMNICSTIDKYEKLSLKELKDEFGMKGLDEKQIEFLCELFEFSAKNDSLSILKKLKEFNNEKINAAVADMELLINYLKIFNVTKYKLDLTLARGLSYYTGIIFEGTFQKSEIGSVCGGGRYDELCKSISTFETPCVGFSIGLSRILNALPITSKYLRKDCLIGSAYLPQVEERMKLMMEIQEEFTAELMNGECKNYKAQLQYAEKNNFKVVVFTGEKEIENGELQIVESESKEKKVIKREDLLSELRKLL